MQFLNLGLLHCAQELVWPYLARWKHNRARAKKAFQVIEVWRCNVGEVARAIAWLWRAGLVIEEIDLGDVVRIGQREPQQQIGVVTNRSQDLGCAEAKTISSEALDEPIDLVDRGRRVESVRTH